MPRFRPPSASSALSARPSHLNPATHRLICITHVTNVTGCYTRATHQPPLTDYSALTPALLTPTATNYHTNPIAIPPSPSISILDPRHTPHSPSSSTTT